MSDAPALAPAADGALEGSGALVHPLANPRLQVRVDARGVHDLFVWGGGTLGGVRIHPAAPPGARARVTPGRVAFRWDGPARDGALWSVTALPHLPALLLHVRGPAPTLEPCPVRAPPPGFAEPPRVVTGAAGDDLALRAAWGCLELHAPGAALARGASGRLALHLPAGGGWALLAAGTDPAEAAAARRRVLADPDAASRAHAAWAADLQDAFTVDDPLLRSLYLHGLLTAETSRRAHPDGAFAGFAAGYGYAVPSRTYFRDGYWTLQALLPRRPEWARAQLRLLSAAVHPDGEAPSAVLTVGAAGHAAWRARRAGDPELARDHPGDGEWWPDHFDSPLFYCLLACDVAAWTGDPGVLEERIDGRTVRARIEAVLARYARFGDADPHGLPAKPPHDRDWADNVFRGGHVTYDLGLYHGALAGAAAAFAPHRPQWAARLRARAAQLRRAASARLWLDGPGHFAEFRPPDGPPLARLALDTLTAVRWGLADSAQTARALEAVRTTLETRHQPRQPYGDWGVMCGFPPYGPEVRRRAKARFPYRYHDGSDWPYWDGVYAEARLKRDLPGWRYPLARWWSYGLARGWSTPSEYQAPPWGRGSPATGWSSMPAAAMVLGGFGLTPAGAAKPPPWGASELRGLRLRGAPARVTVRVADDANGGATEVCVERDG